MAANSNTRTNTPTQVPALPAIPAGASPELRKYLEALSQVVSIRLGRRGDPRDRAVTLRELIDGGLVKEFASSPFDPNRSGNVGFASPQAFLADLAVPPAPTGFTVNGAYSQINLNWDYPSYSNHSHTEVHVHTSDVIGDATLLGIQTGRVFVDPVGSNQTRYYWVRHVNTDGVAGPFNSASGTAGTTATDVSHLLSVLSSAIDSSELTQTLTDRIDLIDAAATVNGSVAYRVAEEASARATAISAEASARAAAISAEASARAAAIAAIVTDISIHDSNQAYAVGQIVRISNSSSKLYICIQAIAANASVAVTNTAYWKLYGDYDALKSSTDTSAAAITQINTISSSSTSAAAAAINSLNSEVFDANGGSLLATASALNTVQAEVFPNGTSSASRLDTLDAEVFDSNGGSLLATASALNTVQAEVFPNGTSSASRLDTLDAEVFDSNGGSLLATASALGIVQAEVFPDGTSSASRLDTLDAEVFDSNGGSLLATASALNTVQTEVFPDGTSSASRIDTLENTVNHTDTGVSATASAVSALNTEVFPNGNTSASSIDALESTVQNANISLPFNAWNITGHSIETISNGKVGNEVLRLTGSAGNYPNQGTYIPIDPTKKYQVRFWARPSSNAAGLLYFSLRQFLNNTGSAGPNNSGRSPYKPSGFSRANHNSTAGTTNDWYEYVYIWDNSDWQTGVKYFQPEFLDNYSGQAGYWEIQGFVINEVTELEELSSTTSTALSALNTEVYGSGGGTTSRIDSLETTVNHADTGVSATASAVSALNTEIFPNGTSSASRIDALDNILLDSNGNAVVSATNLSSMKNQILNSDGTQTATATQMNQLSASYTDPTTGQQNTTLQTALETSASNVNGLRSQYSVKIDSNGNVAGFGLASTSSAAGTSSEFTVVADRFSLVSGSDTLKTVPFAVQATATTINGQSVPAGVYMDNAFIKNGSIEAAKIGSLNAERITSGTIDADRIGANSVDASKIRLDNSTITSQDIGGVPTVVVQDLSVGILDSGLIKADKIKVDDVTLDTDGNNRLKIKNLGVDTLQIKGNAVTIPSANFTRASQPTTGNSTQIQTLSFTSSGAPLLFLVSYAATSESDETGTDTWQSQIKVNSTQVHYVTHQAIRGHAKMVAFQFTLTSNSAGSKTVTLHVASNSFDSVSNVNLSVLEVKK